MFSYKIHSLADSEMFVQTISKFIQPGTVLALQGDLGAGKTTFTQLLAKDLGITQNVKSPTFTVMNQYPLHNDTQLIHLDLYRLKDSSELEALGLQELLDERQHIIVIEWPELAKTLLPKGTLWLEFSIVDEDTRNIAIGEL